MFIFHVESHPQYSWYEQCVTFNSFPTRAHEISYAAFGMLLMYVLPLAVFVVTYGAILVEISRHSQEGIYHFYHSLPLRTLVIQAYHMAVSLYNGIRKSKSHRLIRLFTLNGCWYYAM